MRMIASLLLAIAAGSATGSDVLSKLTFPIGEHVAYVERQANTMLKAPTAQEGTLWIEPNGDMVMSVEQPFTEIRRLNGTHVSVERFKDDRSRTRRAKLRANKPSHLVLLAITALLSGNTPWLFRHFEAREEISTMGWTVDLIPLDAGVRKKLEYIRLSGLETQLHRLHAHRGEGRWTELTIRP